MLKCGGAGKAVRARPRTSFTPYCSCSHTPQWPTEVCVGPVWPICAANSELLFAADQLCAARLLRPQNLKTRHGGFWIEHSLQLGPGPLRNKDTRAGCCRQTACRAGSTTLQLQATSMYSSRRAVAAACRRDREGPSPLALARQQTHFIGCLASQQNQNSRGRTSSSRRSGRRPPFAATRHSAGLPQPARQSSTDRAETGSMGDEIR
eukprot:COSAG01_NODE_11347_length_1953_cov_2.493528_3_plen_207_part_00